MTPDYTTAGTIAGGILAATWAMWERFRNKRVDQRHQVDLAKDELVKVLGADRDAWKSRYESEHAEFIDYRRAAHDQSQTTQAKILKLGEENGELRAKTDITPLMKHQAEQSAINAKIVESLDRILKHLTNEGTAK